RHRAERGREPPHARERRRELRGTGLPGEAPRATRPRRLLRLPGGPRHHRGSHRGVPVVAMVAPHSGEGSSSIFTTVSVPHATATARPRLYQADKGTRPMRTKWVRHGSSIGSPTWPTWVPRT